MRWVRRKKLPDRYWLLERDPDLYVVSPDGRIVSVYGNNSLGRPQAERMRDNLNRIHLTGVELRSLR